jgi:hypothetical protein
MERNVMIDFDADKVMDLPHQNPSAIEKNSYIANFMYMSFAHCLFSA